jgi:hypothetical protein
MHCFFSSGIVEVELICFLQACKTIGVYQKHLLAFMAANWQQAKSSKGKIYPHKLFNDSKEEYNSFPGSASDLMSIVPLLEHFVEQAIQPTGLIPEQTKSCLLLCRVCSLLMFAKTLANVPDDLVNQLQMHQIHHMKAFVKAYGESACKPKHHFSLHVGLQIRKFRFVLDAFVHERKHRTLKQAFNTMSYVPPQSLALTLVQRVSFDHLQQKKRIEEMWLLGKSMGAQTTSQMRVPFGIISAGDVLTHNNLAVTVLSCCNHDGFFICVRRWSYVRSSSSARWWVATTETELIPAALVSPA